jgi:hypothetical protein
LPKAAIVTEEQQKLIASNVKAIAEHNVHIQTHN